MSIRIDGTNTTANPGITGGDADTGLQFGTDEISFVTGGTERAKIDNGALKVTGQSSGITDEGLTLDWASSDNNGRIFSESASSSNLLFYTTDSGTRAERMRISQNGGVRLPDVHNQTIALSANVFIDTDGTLKRATSSIKYKTNVETLEDQYADAVLNCRPVWYQSTSPGDNPNWGFWGFIAEEVAEIDPRLVQWKTVEQVVNEDGSRDTVPLNTPEPENVAYDRFVPHLLNLIKRQQQAIETLEAKVAALEVNP